jgi:preprotein translocase subunit YajC
MSLATILLQAAPATPGTGGGYTGILMLILIFVVFYFFLIRPQSKRQKEIKKQREAMKAGDHVITSGGIYGRIKEVKDTTLIIEIAENVRVKVDKNSVFLSPEDIQTQAR